MAAEGALILDFDRSVLPVPDSVRIDLAGWQEAIRYGCRRRTLRALEKEIAPALARQPGIVFTGSGDYHHVTCLLLERYRGLGRPVQVVVFDNHPDNMRYPFGVHCGSWVWHASRLPFVSKVHVLGITSRDVEIGHAWENHLHALRAGKVRYWCIGRDLAWMRYLGIVHSRAFPSVAEMLQAFGEAAVADRAPIHLSIDKDVLSRADVCTNWDQGVMRLEELLATVGLLRERILGCDVTGEVSVYSHRSGLKRFLSGLDSRPGIPLAQLARWQEGHRVVNLRLRELLAPSKSG